MSWNDGNQRKIFYKKQEKQAQEYRKLGMTEKQIKAMFDFDLEQYKSDRRFYMHTQQFTTSDFDEGGEDETESTLFEKFFDELTVSLEDSGYKSRYWWMEEIEDVDLANKIKLLNPKEIEILTLLFVDGYSMLETAELIGVPYRSFKRQLSSLKRKIHDR